ncbi:MAG TPA: DUF4235 domain-containing protein [Solirubrobacter sp.]|nr:DUF4235 domain-containing protein [Solirubrobacter sp.]
MNVVFAPIGIVLGLAGGQAATKLFDWLWSRFDDEEAPEPRHREVPFAKLLLALALQGVIFRLVRGLVDHGARHGWQKLTGTWPGEERPEPE